MSNEPTYPYWLKLDEFPDLTQCGSDCCWIENGSGVPPEKQEGGSYEGQAGQGEEEDDKNGNHIFWQSLYLRLSLDLHTD